VRNSLLILPVILLVSNQLLGQHYTVNNYTTAEGLPSSEVYEIYQDRKGFIWFGTDNGISRFDGFEFKNYHIKDGLTDPVVFGFQEDEDGTVWYRTYSGRLCYMNRSGVIEHYKYNDLIAPFVQGGFLSFRYFAKEKLLYFSSKNILGSIDSTGALKHDTLNYVGENSPIPWKLVNGVPMVVQTFRHARVDGVQVEGKHYPLKISSPQFANKVYRLLVWNGKIYYSAFNFILEFDGTKVTVAYQAKYPIISITLDRNNHLWVGYLNNGVDRFTDATFQTKISLDIVKNKSVTCVKQTSDGAFWLSTLENGVVVIPNMAITHYDIPVDGKIKTVSSGKKFVVLAEKGGRVKFYDAKSRTVVEEKKIEHDVLLVYADRKDNYWISGHETVEVFDSRLRQIKNFSGINIVDVSESKADGAIFAVGSQRIHRFDNLNPPATKISVAMYRQVLVHDTTLYFATRVGLSATNLAFEYPRPLKNLQSDKFSDLIALNDSLLFLPTNGNGFYVLDTKSQQAVHYEANNFFANNIHATIVKNNNLWLGTDKGIAILSVPSLLSGEPKFQYLNHKSGLRGKAINFLAATDHEVWAIGDDVISIVPDSIQHFAESQPKFYIREMTCNDAPVDLSQPLNFSSQQNNLRISFGFISFNNDEIFHRYRVNDDEPWIYSTDRVAQFTSLAPGQYKFSLQYSVDNYYWTNATELIPFEIAAPWYRRWYVYPIAFFMLMAVAYGYLRSRQRVYREKNDFLNIINEHQQKLIQSEITAIERERNRIAKELHDGVGTNLTAIKLSVRQLLHQHREPLANEIEDQFQQTIAEIKDIIYDLTPPSLERYGLFTAFKNYINKIGKNIPISITVKTFGPEVTSFSLNIIVFRILQELLSNSIKHSQAKNISVHLNAFEDLLNIIYEDDGVGFTYDPVQGGLGLNNIESRIRSLNGTLKFDSGNFGVSYNIDIPLTSIKESK
jgi:signal transduction histidine kinase/ligand-binding sensor domain-containing protein